MERIKRELDDYNNSNNKKAKLFNQITIINRKSYFENLANETIYEIFEYLDVYHIYYSFYNLNQRFQNFFLNSNIQINISQISQSNFEDYHKNLIIPNQHRINSLHLSNPFTVDIIFSPPRLICDFIQLERLTLENIHAKYLDNILKHLISLPKFHSLILSPVDYIPSATSLFARIFRLPKLKSCQVTYRTKTIFPIRFNEYYSSSIEHLAINSCFRYESLNDLLNCLPKLRHLSIDYLIGSEYSHMGLRPIQLKDLKSISLNLNSIHYHQFEELIKNYFGHIEVLQISMSNDQSYLHAERWEELISSSIPTLRIFDIKHDMKQEDFTPMDRFMFYFLMQRFESSFWSKKQWFFTNRHNQKGEFNDGMFYSINPYRRKDYQFNQQIYCSNIEEKDFNSVKHLQIYGQRTTNYSEYYFPNVTELTIEHSAKISILNRILPLKQLKKLVLQSLDFPVEQFLQLISFLPNLNRLQLHSLSFFQTNVILLEQSEIFRNLSNTNQIQYLEYHASCATRVIQFIDNLFPQLEYLKIGMYRKEILAITRYLLLKTHQLFFLCITKTPKTCLKELNVLIETENLLDRYSIKLINRDLYIWW